MANTDRVFGFKLTHDADPKYVRRCAVNSSYGTALAVGDVVKSSGQSDGDGYIEVNVTAAGDTNSLGIIIGMEPIRTDLAKNYIPASTGGFVHVYVDPLAIYEVQEDSDGGALAAADVGQLIDLVDAGVDTNTGNSGQEIDSSSAGASGQFSVLEMVHREDNEVGNQAKWHVMFAEHMLVSDAVAV